MKRFLCGLEIWSLKHVNVEGKTDGCMIAEGMVLETMSVSESVEAAMDSSRSLFRICPALSYDASTGLYELEAKLACGDSIPEEKLWEMRRMLNMNTNKIKIGLKL